ncbi:MAG: SRPBCC domain-containing protein [Verrucomicrobia bacterium]|nr:SRPBCC domain-containing protein [Verrucomicrobiota bacterium]
MPTAQGGREAQRRPCRLVFEAWTAKEHLDQWCAPHGFTIPWSEGDLRPGGAWRCCLRSPEGVEYRLGGTYREIVQDELLVFTPPDRIGAFFHDLGRNLTSRGVRSGQ